MTPVVRSLREADIDEYIALRQASLHERPLAFAASPSDDFASSPELLRETIAGAPDRVIFCAWEQRLTGAVGLIRDRHLKAAHKMHLWGMCVAPSSRCRGIGSALLAAAIGHARLVHGVTLVHLGVTSAAGEARRLYERAGFEAWGTEPQAVIHDGLIADDTRMFLRL